MNTTFHRRKFLGSLGFLGTIGAMNPFSVLAEENENKPLPGALVKCQPYLQAVSTNGIMVRWITSGPAHCWVEYGEERNRLDKKASQIENGMVQVQNTIHAVELKHLQPGKTYYYRTASQPVEKLDWKDTVFGETIYSETASFNTRKENPEEVEFLVFNDIHDRPESFPLLMQYDDKRKKDFVFLNGDIFDVQKDENQIITNLLDPLSQLFATHTPFVFGRGNHETHGPYARQITDYFDGGEEVFYFSMDYGPMWAIVLDSGDAKPDEDPLHAGITDFDTYREVQAEWLKKEVQKEGFRKAAFKVVFIHIPAFYTAKPIHAAEQYQKLWGPILEEAGIDLMICGHTHRHGVHPAIPGQHSYPIVIGGGPNDGKRTLIDVKVNNKELRLKMTNDLGKVVGELNLKA